ncbi:MAG: polyamine aminopropyltransferase [Alphaproteobacteria bacterium]
MTDWFREDLYPSVSQNFARGRVLYEGDTDFQHVEIFENAAMGRVMALDGIVQTTEKDEFVYHEMMAHVPLFAHGDVRRVLIIGGGDGGVLREVLRHPVDRVTMVDIDGQVIELCEEFLPSLSAGAFDDPRADVIVGDGVQFVADCADQFDAVIIDSTDPVGPGEGLFTKSFYRRCAAILADQGIVVTQNGVPYFQADELVRTSQRFEGVFAHFGFYVVAVPTYYGGFMTLGWGSNARDLSQRLATRDVARIEQAGFKTRYYNAAIHEAAFALPQYIQDLAADARHSNS